MLRLFLFILLMSALQIHASSFKPIDTIPEQSRTDYQQCSNRQYATAILMVSAGSAACLAAVALIAAEIAADESVSWVVGEVEKTPIPTWYYFLMFGGAILALCSIPVFKSAGKYRRLAKTATVGFNLEKLSNFPTASISKSYFPSIKLNLRF